MRFKDLEEGKKYIAFQENGSRVQTFEFGEPKPCTYTIIDGLLYSDIDGHFSKLTFAEVQKFTFEPYVEYHTLEEAVEWMKQGGKCRYDDEIIKIDDMECPLPQLACYDGDTWEYCDFYLCYLEPKWILLDKEVDQ